MTPDDQFEFWLTALWAEDANTRQKAAYALGAMRTEHAVRPLIARLWESDPRVVMAIETALQNIGAPAVKPLIHALQTHSLEVIRCGAAKVLGTMEDPHVVATLIQALQDPEDQLRLSVVDALGGMKDPRVIDALIQALQDPWLEVRRVAATCLGLRGDPQAVEPLIQIMQDPEWRVRRTVAGNLGRIQTPQVVDALIHALQDRDYMVRMTVICTLEAMGDPRAVPALRRVRDHDEDVLIRDAAASAVAGLEKTEDPS